MRIVSWNINSVRLRAPLLHQIQSLLKADIICLQETKVSDDLFPWTAIEPLGFPHVLRRGIKGYNGVAILSKLPLVEIEAREWCGRADARHIAARIDTINGPVVIHNFYVPAGGDVPDPETNPKFAHKLAFLEEMAMYFKELADDLPIVLVGDLNIAPLEHDVWSHKQLLNVVSHTPIEVERLGTVQESGRFADSARLMVPADEKLYSWWSYRARDWSASDRGRRLDHVWLTPPLVPHLAGGGILRAARGWEQPSDHAPVWADLWTAGPDAPGSLPLMRV